MSDEPKLLVNPFRFPDHTKSKDNPEACLSPDPRAQACWYFYLLAHKQWEKVGDSIDNQIVLDDELWMDKRYVQTAKTIAMMYSLESPDEFAKAWDEVRAEAARWGLPEPREEYTRLCPRLIIN